MEDKSIIQMFWNREENAIRETDLKYRRMCYGISKNILGNHEDAEECLNDTYLTLWNTIPPKQPDNLMAYVAKVTRNHSLKRLEYYTAEKRDARGVVVPLEELEDVLPDNGFSSQADEEAIGEHINRFLRGEGEDARNIFLRKYWFYDSIKDIAERFDISEAKVKSTLFYTRNRLKKYLIKRGIYL